MPVITRPAENVHPDDIPVERRCLTDDLRENIWFEWREKTIPSNVVDKSFRNFALSAIVVRFSRIIIAGNRTDRGVFRANW